MHNSGFLYIGVLKNFNRLIIIFLVIIFFALYIYGGSFPLQNTATTCNKLPDIVMTNSTKVILLWNNYYFREHWDFRSSVTDLLCSDSNCIITSNQSFLPSLEEYDALLFHGAQKFEIPPRRDPKQLYVFGIREAPHGTPRFMVPNFYNMTMHYRLDSDIFWPYFQVVDTKTGEHVAPAYYPKWKNSSYYQHFVPSTSLIQRLKKKTKSAAWFVSHCITQSRREKLVKELQKYIQVDIYGKCGNLSCILNDEKGCNVILKKDYKFYLSFENGLCTDYVTEKLQRALLHSVVPIVFGGANYSRFAPPNSYINVEDFATVEELGKFLTNLEQNIDEYAKYFWWKKFYHARWYDTPKPFCDLCSRLHKTPKPETQIYRSLEDYWFPVCRKEARIKFE